jgi:uncharacterized membrane protein YfcA
MRLALLLQLAMGSGGLLGGLISQFFSTASLRALFSATTTLIAIVVLARLDRRNVIRDLSVDPGGLGGRFFDDESGGEVVYRIRRLPLALGASFIAGSVSNMVGIGGGVLLVPILNSWCGAPIRAAAATSAVVIGVSAAAAAPIYAGRGDLIPHAAAAAVLGVIAGAQAGFWASRRSQARSLKLLMAAVLFMVSASMMLGGGE